MPNPHAAIDQMKSPKVRKPHARAVTSTEFLTGMQVGRDDASAGRVGTRLDGLTDDEIRRSVFGAR